MIIHPDLPPVPIKRRPGFIKESIGFSIGGFLALIAIIVYLAVYIFVMTISRTVEAIQGVMREIGSDHKPVTTGVLFFLFWVIGSGTLIWLISMIIRSI